MRKFTLLLLLFCSSAFAERFAIIGDAGLWNKNTRMVRDSIKKNGVRQLVMPGDNVYKEKSPHSSYEKAWGPWRDEKLDFSVVAIGNHTKGYEEEIAFFKMPGEYHTKVYSSSDVRFIVLNSDNKQSVSEQISWLENSLNKVKNKFIFLVYHHPSFSIHSGHYWEEREEFQRALQPILKKYRKKITALLVGHDHVASLLHFDDLPVIVSGATFLPSAPEWIDNTQEGVRVKNAWLYDGADPYWVFLDIPPQKKEARFSFVNARTNKVYCTGKIATGQPARLASDCTKKAQ